MDEFGPRLVQIVRGAATARIPRVKRLAERVRAAHLARQVEAGALAKPALRKTAARAPASRRARQTRGLVLVGASTGGPSALDALLGALPADFPWPILVAQHMPGTFTAALARRLNGVTALDVVEVTAPSPLTAGRVFVGRGDADLLVSQRPGGLVALATPTDERYRWHPSVDRLTESALALLPPEELIGVLMTGMGNDGATAMARLRALGGRTIAEAEETAVVWGMPGELVRAGGASVVAPLEGIGRALSDMLAP
jgi:two-component system chemotaxis response regulator CheB